MILVPPFLIPFRGRHQMRGQLRRKVVAIDLHLDQVHGESKLLVVEKTILVDIGELPDLSEHGIGEFRLHHLGLGRWKRFCFVVERYLHCLRDGLACFVSGTVAGI